MKKCKIVFLDEVHAKVTGLDPVTVNACIDKLKFMVPYRFHMPAYKLGRWDGSIRFFEKSGKTFINLLPDVLPIIAKNGYDFDIEDNRKTGAINLRKIDKNIFAEHTWPEGHFMEGQPIQLRDDQVDAANYFSENRNGLQVLATGFGKCVAGDTVLEIDGFGETTIEEFYLYCADEGEMIEPNSYRIDGMYTITAPDGETQILGITRKDVSETYTFTFDNGYECTVSPEHKFFVDGLPVEARNIFIYNSVDHIDGTLGIAKLQINEQPATLYDIAVEYPNAYYDANGVLHHNTLLTAAVCKVAEDIGRTVTIVPSKSLVEQTADDFRLVKMDVGVYYGDEKDPTHMHTITTWQSLNEIFENKRMDVIDAMFNGVKQVLVDECFDGDSPVLTPNGEVPIKEIKEGDTVINYCEDTKTFKEDTVVAVHENLTHSNGEEMLELVFDNGQTIRVTANHKFLTDHGWIRADQLTAEMEVISIPTSLGN